MAGEDNNREARRGDDHEESSPLLQGNDTKINSKVDTKTAPIVPPPAAEEYGWTADGLPVRDGSVIGEPIGRNQWNSGLFSCFGRNDEFCSSDLEVCLLGSVAPCVLYGTNAERLGSAPGTFSNHCLTYSGLYFIGKSLFGWNCLAPWFSYSSRSAIRRKFNLEGSFEAMNRSCGCCGSCIEDEMQREHMETTCDFVTHVLCHTCALCQEGRELRRKVLHPGFNAQALFVCSPRWSSSSRKPINATETQEPSSPKATCIMGQARINRSNKPKPEANRSAKDATENHQRPRRFAWNPRVILAFDIITQEFREVPFPDEERPNSVVGSLNGRLCVFNTSYDLRDDIWVMNEYGVASSWTRIRISLLCRLMKPVCSTKNSEEVLLALDKYMVLYNFETHAWRKLELHGVDLTQGFDVNTYVESLVSPNSYGLDNRRKHFDFKLYKAGHKQSYSSR